MSALERQAEFAVEPMRLSDVSNVLAIERVCFPSPWPAYAYRYELARSDRSRYFVVRPGDGQLDGDDGSGNGGGSRLTDRLRRVIGLPAKRGIVGYGGFWTSGYRLHISTLAVSPRWRGRGVGLLLVLHILDCAATSGARKVTLEVRVSNQTAQNLYRKCGFRRSGLHRGYYSDNSEDALLMSTPPLTRREYQAQLSELQEELRERLGHRPAAVTR